MTWYELLLFLHIVAAIIWLGSGLFIQILATRAERAGDTEGLRRVANDSANLSETLFIPDGAVHTARNVGSGSASELATYVVRKGEPLLRPAE